MATGSHSAPVWDAVITMMQPIDAGRVLSRRSTASSTWAACSPRPRWLDWRTLFTPLHAAEFGAHFGHLTDRGVDLAALVRSRIAQPRDP